MSNRSRGFPWWNNEQPPEVDKVLPPDPAIRELGFAPTMNWFHGFLGLDLRAGDTEVLWGRRYPVTDIRRDCPGGILAPSSFNTYDKNVEDYEEHFVYDLLRALDRPCKPKPEPKPRIDALLNNHVFIGSFNTSELFYVERQKPTPADRPIQTQIDELRQRLAELEVKLPAYYTDKQWRSKSKDKD